VVRSYGLLWSIFFSRELLGTTSRVSHDVKVNDCGDITNHLSWSNSCYGNSWSKFCDRGSTVFLWFLHIFTIVSFQITKGYYDYVCWVSTGLISAIVQLRIIEGFHAFSDFVLSGLLYCYEIMIYINGQYQTLHPNFVSPPASPT